MLPFDVAVVRYLNQFANHSCTFDVALRYLSSPHLLKGVFVFALVWWALFGEPRRPERRDALLAVLLLAVVALFVTRGLALVLPFRARPLHDARLAFELACGYPRHKLEAWSSFPSDHAVLYSMLASGIAFASHRLGAIAFTYVIAVILLPRVYFGLHWPTDIVAGAALGIGFAQFGRIPAVRGTIGRWAAALRTRQPGPFHAGLFLWSYLTATNFDEVRSLAHQAATLLRGMRP
jgi:undecaprenyl-diphosphatase